MPWVGAGSVPPLWAKRGKRGEEPRGCGPSGSSPVHWGWAFTPPAMAKWANKKGRGGGGHQAPHGLSLRGDGPSRPRHLYLRPQAAGQCPKRKGEGREGVRPRTAFPFGEKPVARLPGPSRLRRGGFFLEAGTGTFRRRGESRGGAAPCGPPLRQGAGVPAPYLPVGSSKIKGERQVQSIKAPHGLSPCPRKIPLKRSLRPWLLFQPRFADGSLRNSRFGRGCQPGKMKKSALANI